MVRLWARPAANGIGLPKRGGEKEKSPRPEKGWPEQPESHIV